MIYCSIDMKSHDTTQQPPLQDKMHVKEWLHQSAKRPVKVKFGPEEAFHLLNRKGEKLRSVDVKVFC